MLDETLIEIPDFGAAAVFVADPDGTLIELVQSPGDLEAPPAGELERGPLARWRGCRAVATLRVAGGEPPALPALFADAPAVCTRNAREHFGQARVAQGREIDRLVGLVRGRRRCSRWCAGRTRRRRLAAARDEVHVAHELGAEPRD